MVKKNIPIPFKTELNARNELKWIIIIIFILRIYPYKIYKWYILNFLENFNNRQNKIFLHPLKRD